MKTVLAIPSFNGAELLQTLLTQAIKQNFYKIYVLDDSSTDNSRDIYKRFPEVEVVFGHKNIGPVANKNRVLGQDLGDVIFFLDDDMDIKTPDIPEKLNELFKKDNKIAVIGAKIVDLENKQLIFNFERESNPLFRWVERPFISPKMTEKEFNNPLTEVAWVLEGACAIKSEVFVELKGFDERFIRYAEGPDLCKRVLDLGYKVYMTNSIKLVHTRDLKIFTPSHYYRYFRSSLTWYRLHAFKRK
jgi:GT2 family glycosyltransferase